VNVSKAIASFERSIVSARSPYDRYHYAGEEDAISESAKRGEVVFFTSSRAACYQCHGGFNFSDAVDYAGKLRGPFRSTTTVSITCLACYSTADESRPVRVHERPNDIGKSRPRRCEISH